MIRERVLAGLARARGEGWGCSFAANRHAVVKWKTQLFAVIVNVTSAPKKRIDMGTAIFRV